MEKKRNPKFIAMLFDFNRDGKFSLADLAQLAQTAEAREAVVTIAARFIVASETKADDEAVLLLADIAAQAKMIIDAGEVPSAQGYVRSARTLLSAINENVDTEAKGNAVFKASYDGISAALLSLETGLDDGTLQGSEVSQAVAVLISALFGLVPLLGN